MAILFPDTAGQATDGSFIHTQNGLTWAWNGSSWFATGFTGTQYILPTASTSVLGGVKVDGTTITISNGIISSSGGGGGGSGLTARSTVNASSGSIANDASANVTVTGFKSYALLKALVSEPAWVVVYTDSTKRTADASRTITTDPSPGSGVLAEFITSTSNETVLFTPAVLGFNNDSPAATNVYLKIVNRSGSTNTISVTLTLVKLEE